MRRSESGHRFRPGLNGEVEREALLPQSGPGDAARPPPHKRDKNEDDDRSVALRSLQRQRDAFVEVDVQPGQTLASLALKYNVAPAELKRLNNILRDTEFHALSRVRVPARPGSALREMIEVAGIHGGDGPGGGRGGGAQNGWLVEHFASPAATHVTSDSLPCSSGINSPVFSEDEVAHAKEARSPPSRQQTQMQPKSREVRKARRIFKSVDRELASIKLRNEAIITQGDKGGGEEDECQWDDFGDDDDGLEEASLLQDGGGLAKVSVMASNRSRAVCLACLGMVVVAVALILWFSRHWYQEIREEEERVLKEAQEEARIKRALGNPTIDS